MGFTYKQLLLYRLIAVVVFAFAAGYTTYQGRAEFRTVGPRGWLWVLPALLWLILTAYHAVRLWRLATAAERH
ncbi:hypothetical protein [Lacticaseibacillus parakribbianus]|uniref:hypothetical protein n=1 Tax=Lacticaseibacillus parakribbianus TaxID=2970927 RepID=UPI0021CB4DD8|nr:hypothetical protein [Lacticaseibacillus parakribbianus]